MFRYLLWWCAIALCIGTLARAGEAADAEILWNAQNVPAWILPKTDGELLLPRTEAEPFAQALAAVTAYSAQFRIGPDDSFSLITVADGQDVDGIAYPPEEDEEQDPIAPPAPKSANGKTTTVWLQQTHQGLEVSGGQIAVAMNDTGVLSIQGTFYPDIALKAIDALPADLLAKQAALSLTDELGYTPEITWLDAKAQVRVDETGIAHHVRLANVEYPGSQGYENDNLMVDTTDGSIVARLPNIHRAIKTVNDWHQRSNRTAARCLTTATTGTLPAGVERFSSGPTQFFSEPWFDFLNFAWWGTIDPTNHIYKAWEHSAVTESFYLRNFNQRSYDNRNSPIISNVRFSPHRTFENGLNAGCEADNAFWRAAVKKHALMSHERQVYYEPAGASSPPYANLWAESVVDFNVGAHELTHGVTELSSNLEYQNESGAMNEASSDIMAEAAEWWIKRSQAFKYGTVDWQVASDWRTPTSNRNMLLFNAGRPDALRYFYNPSLDRFNLSRAPDGAASPIRTFFFSPRSYGARNGGSFCRPNSTNDYCYVHSNSGILNHFFFMLSRGGEGPNHAEDTHIGTPPYTHGIGIARAMRIWYGATLGAGPNRVGPRATFRDLRNATIREAQRLYGRTPEADTPCDPQTLAVIDAWNKTGWSDDLDPTKDLERCLNQINLVLNGSFENENAATAVGIEVANWTAVAAEGVPPPPNSAWATFAPNAAAPDERISAFLGGTGAAGVNSIRTTIQFPHSISAARLDFSTDLARPRGSLGRLTALEADPGDYLSVTIHLATTGAVVMRHDIPSTALRRLPNTWSLVLNPVQRLILQGHRAELRFTHVENDGIPTRAVVDAVSLVVAP